MTRVDLLTKSLAWHMLQVVIADVDIERAQVSVKELRELGHQATAAKCDVSIKAEVDAAVAIAVEQFGGLDIAVANAGST
jgi:NAD(P)-dependent dehydrogenase (short-subunit alcohol dehydrogenase family)